MKKLLYLAMLAIVFSLVFAPAALAQQDLDCSDFSTQEEAQAVYDQAPSDPNDLDADGDGVACETLPAGEMEDGTVTGGNGDNGVTEQNDLDCVDFASQAEAQATYDAYPSDPNGLDADGDGIACEFTESAGEIFYEDGSIIYVTTAGPSHSPDAAADQYVGDGVESNDEEPAAQDTIPNTELPDTGGPTFLVPASILLLGTGLLGLRILRQ